MGVCRTENSIVLKTRTVEITIKHFTSSFVGPRKPYLSLHSDIVRVSVMLGDAP